MKKLYYLLAILAVGAAFSACSPLSKMNDQLNALPSNTQITANPVIPPITFSVTLAAADYGLLPSADYAKTKFYYKTTDDAKVSIPAILAAKYPTYPDKSSASVTYAFGPVSIAVADTLNADVNYTLTAADYTLLPGNKFTDFSTAQILSWLPYKYPTPAANQLAVLTYTYFESGKTPSAGVPATDAFLYLNGVWTKIYRISNAQYASVGNGTNNWFIAADAGNLVSYFNTFLKSDAAVMATAKFGTVIYVNYRYLTTYQRVLPLTFDGTNWVTTPTPLTLTFLKTNGVWVADNTVYYTLVQADYTYMGTQSPSTIGSTAARANIASFPDFNTSATTDATYWSDADITSIIADFAKHKYGTTAVLNQKFTITYAVYNFGVVTNKTKTYQYDGTNFNLVP